LWNERVQQEYKKKLTGDSFLHLDAKLPDHLLAWHKTLTDRENAATGLSDDDVAGLRQLSRQVLSSVNPVDIGPHRQISSIGQESTPGSVSQLPAAIALQSHQLIAAPSQANVISFPITSTATLPQPTSWPVMPAPVLFSQAGQPAAKKQKGHGGLCSQCRNPLSEHKGRFEWHKKCKRPRKDGHGT
jgi:hypothetical protein